MSCECERNKPLMERRSFLNKIVFGVGGIIGTVLSLPLIMAMLDPVLRDRGEKWRQVADLSEFKPGETKMVKFKTPLHIIGERKSPIPRPICARNLTGVLSPFR